jgi:IS30 family transposase
MLSKNKKLEEIGTAIGSDKSMVSKENRRNRDQRSEKHKPDFFNGLIIQYFLSETNIESLKWSQVRQVEKMLNNRTGRKFGHRTPNKVFILLTKKVAFAA